MDTVETLKRISELAFKEMTDALEGVTEGKSWAVLPSFGSKDYLNTDGSIHGIALHVASCKVMYGSIAFRNTEVRWRNCADRIEKFEPNWSAARDYLNESQKYWMESWENLSDKELENEVPHFSGKVWPAWKIIRMMLHHDSYHAGQITILRYAVGESSTPPPSVAEDIRKYCAELVSW